jgi:NAD(P)-dependent dehydrogenase (short-subunit alcohol dehydrogenase family)
VRGESGRILLKDEVVVVTGGAGGFGAAVTQRLLDLGAIVYALDVLTPDDAAAKLPINAPASGGRCRYVKVDITSGAELAKFVKDLRAKHPNGVYGLVNNAGITGTPTAAIQAPNDVLRNVLDVNFFAAAELSRLMFDQKAPAFRCSPKRCVTGQPPTRSRIVNVTSVAGVMSASGVSAYTASKFALEGFSDATRIECGDKYLDVAIIEPYFAVSGIYRSILDETADFSASILAESFEHSRKRFKNALANNVLMSADYVASFIVRALLEAVPQDRYMVSPLKQEAAVRVAMHLPNYNLVLDNAKRDWSKADDV